MQQPPGILEVTSATAAIIAAIGAAVAAVGSWKAAKATQRSAEAQLTANLLDAYSTQDMREALDALRRWDSEHRIDLGAAFKAGKHLEVEHHRRLVSHHFQKIHDLWRLRFLSEKTVRVVATEGQVEIYRRVIEPLEWAKNPKYDRTSFETLGGLYGIAGHQFVIEMRR